MIRPLIVLLAVLAVIVFGPPPVRATEPPTEPVLRIEPEMHGAIVRELRAAGYESVTIDPKGYRTGSLNEGLILRQI